MKQEAFTQGVIYRAADILMDLFSKLEDVGGPIGDKVSKEEQMKAYLQYKTMNFEEQANIRVQMDAMHGPGEAVKWEREMESRHQRSLKQKVQPDVEVL